MAQEQRPKPVQIVSPKGTFRFPKLSEPDYGNEKFPKPDGEYSVQLILRLDSPEAIHLISKLSPLHEQAVAEAKEAFSKLPVATRKKLKEVTINDPVNVLYDKDTEEETGEVFFKFAMKASGERKKGPKAGTRWERQPVVFDAKGKRLDPIPEIWGGTVGKVSASVTSYFIPGTGAAGIKLNLEGVQILDLVKSGGRSASSLGFGEEEGYTAEETPFENSEDPSGGLDDGNF